MNNTYAIDTSPVCPVGYYLDTWSSSDTACCPKNPEYKYGGKAYGGSCSLAGSIGSNYETCPYGTKGTAGSCWIASVQPEAPACYVCGGSSQGVGSYVWGNYSQSSACTKTSLTYENCKAPTYSCWICDANSSGNREYKWATSAPSTSCSSGSWYKSSTITSAANCVAPTTTTYTATFYTNDGTTEKSTKVVNKGDKVVKPEDPTREGYTFDGWYDKKENGKEYDFTKEVTSDISLYAYWSKIGDKTNEDVNKNSKTGDVLIFIAWTAGIGALTYSVYYFKSRKETI